MVYRINNLPPPQYNPVTQTPYDSTWTFLHVSDDTNYQMIVGEQGLSVYGVKLSKHYPQWEFTVGDFLSFHQNKQILLCISDDDLAYVKQTYEGHTYNDAYLRDYECSVLVHSTTAAAAQNILADGALKCWNRLHREGSITESAPIGQLLGDPPEFSDYIMFSHGGLSGEIVTASKEAGHLEMNPDKPYTPGMRLYFDAAAIARDGRLLRDGMHSKVYDILPLKPYLLYYATWDKCKSDFDIPTPRNFTDAANHAFSEQFGDRYCLKQP